jgi:hypothetical protein
MNAETIGGIALFLFIAVTLWFNTPASSVNGQDPVETTAAFHLLRKDQMADGRFVVRDSAGALLGEYGIVGSQLFQTPAQARDGHLEVSLVRDYYLAEPNFDLGTWAGYIPVDDPDVDHFQVGLRYSPCRFLYGTLAPDLAVSQDALGIGCSFYPPAQFVGPYWRHLGLGVWYVAPFADHDLVCLYGISFTTR